MSDQQTDPRIVDISAWIERARQDPQAYTERQARNITATASALEDPDLIRRARADWHTLEQEVGELPDFDERLGVVQRFYLSLPW